VLFRSERWSMENQRDECFADMYVHPQEIDYNIDTLFELIDASGLEFVGFSNPKNWQLERLLGKNPELMERAAVLSDRQRYRLIEVLDPASVTHYEFFLCRPPLAKADWSSDETLLAAIPERNPCMDGWPSRCLFNYDYQIVDLSESEFQFIEAIDANSGKNRTVKEILTKMNLNLNETQSREQNLIMVRALLEKQLIMLTQE